MALAAVDHKPTLALFMALMCDKDLFKAFYGEDLANPVCDTAAFAKYFPTWNFTAEFGKALAAIKKYPPKVKQAQDSWFAVVGADYSGPACPTEPYLKSILVSFTL